MTWNPYITVSRAALYERCPMAYRFRYIDGFASQDSQPAAFGRMVHAGLQGVVQWAIDTGTHLPVTSPPQILVEAIGELMGDEWALTNAELPLSDYSGAMALVLAWAGRTQLDPANVIGVELMLKTTLATEAGQVTLGGVIDRLDWLNQEQGIVEVVDYKTGKYQLTKEQLQLERQINAYAACVLAETPEATGALLTHDHPLNGSVVSAVATEAMMETHAEGLGRMAYKIEADTAFKPKPGGICETCDFLSICEAGKAQMILSNS